jgi:RNA polymerase sigma-54 factor
MLTPRGVFELRYFFSSHVESDDGEAFSSTAIQSRIRKLIEDEPTSKPISDNKISDILQKEGIKVARRTVAKYREQMNIPPSSQRKVLM